MTGDGLWNLIEQRVASTPDDTFIIDERDTEISFIEFRDRSARIAAHIAAKGIGQGTVVSWILPTWTETLLLIAALARLGAVQNPIIPIFREREVGFITRQAGAEWLISPGTWRKFDYGAMAEKLAADNVQLRTMIFDASTAIDGGAAPAPPISLQPNAATWLFYSSGTTSDPKGARHSDTTLCASARAMISGLGITDADRLPVAFPVSHIGGVIYMFVAMLTGCSIATSENFHPVVTLDQFSRQGISLGGPGAPFLLAFLTRQRDVGDALILPGVRAFLSGGAPKSPVLQAEVRDVLKAPLISCYGLTEAPMLTYNRLDDDEATLARTEGRALPTVDLALFAGDERVGPGEEGEIRVKAPQVMLGYIDETLNAEAFDGGGYLRTGDLGRLDPGGNLTITGRLKEIIIRNMENISATEVEGLLHSHPAVQDVAVIGLPDARTGERVCAVVVPASRAALPTLDDLCRHLLDTGLSRRKTPERLEFVDELPRNPMGKVVKAELRTRFQPMPDNALF